MNAPKTKIIATVGPASSSAQMIRRLILAGVSVFRLNFSHGHHGDHEDTLHRIRAMSEESQIPVSVLMDLGGPKIRLNEFETPLTVKQGDQITIHSPQSAQSTDLSCSFPDFYTLVTPGDPLRIDDGRINCRVVSSTPDGVVCKVLNPGQIMSRKGINLPNSRHPIPPFTEKDRSDLLWGLKNGVDWIALSFVEQADDVYPLRSLMEEVGVERPIIAKIERKKAMKNIDGILDSFDGIMVARGDLGVEVSTEEVPVLQKKLIKSASHKNRLVITATQMMESMIANPTPTRAESTDIANAIIDGTDLIMLSAETAVGRYPVKTVGTMTKIARYTEKNLHQLDAPAYGKQNLLSHAEAIAKHAASLSRDLSAACIMLFTLSGQTALLLSKYHPDCPVYAFSPDRQIVQRMAAYRGITPLWAAFVPHTDEMIQKGEEKLLAEKKVKPGDLVITIAGVTRMKGATNMLRLSVIPPNGKSDTE